MKYIILIGDGMADYIIPSLNKTPLQAANTKNLDRISREGRVGLCTTVPGNMPPGSDVANLSIMGYDPALYYTGRGPLEAASMGVSLKDDDIAFRCNLITTSDDGSGTEIIADFSAGHISSAEAAQLIETLEAQLSTDIIHFYAGISYRHLLVIGNCGAEDAICTPPHDVVGQPVSEYRPKNDGDEDNANDNANWGLLNDLMERSKGILKDHEVNRRRIEAGKKPATTIWPWAQGRAPAMPTLNELYGCTSAVICGVDLIKGIGVYAGMDVINVPGATGYLDTDYSAKARSAIEALKDHDLVVVHVEAPDEAGHEGDLIAKIHAIEQFDELVVGAILKALPDFGEYTIAVLPDHPTPIAIKTHTSDPVPFAVYSTKDGSDDVETFDEAAAAKGSLGTMQGHELLPYMFRMGNK